MKIWKNVPKVQQISVVNVILVSLEEEDDKAAMLRLLSKPPCKIRKL